MRRLLFLTAFAFLLQPALAQSGPVFENGMAQVVEAFNNESEWIREELWVETEFDSDDNGSLDRVHVAATISPVSA